MQATLTQIACWSVQIAFLLGADHIVSRQGPPDPLQLELTHWLDLHGVLDFRQHARTDEDLSWPRLITEARGDVGDGANGGVVEPSLEADGAERRKSVRDADTEAVVPPATPRLSQNYR